MADIVKGVYPESSEARSTSMDAFCNNNFTNSILPRKHAQIRGDIFVSTWISGNTSRKFTFTLLL